MTTLDSPRSEKYMSAGAAHLGCTSGKVWFEVTAAGMEGYVRAGFAGTNFREAEVGRDEASWALLKDARTCHR